MKFSLQLAIAFLLYPTSGWTQTVWPGDVNDNGIVNEVDLLFLGFAFNQTGSSRTNASTDWQAQTVEIAWEGTFPNGLSFAYADCNGDGIVDEADAAVIQLNLNRTHNDVPLVLDEILEAVFEEDPQFAFLNEDLTVQGGDVVDLNISLGSADQSVDNLRGLAFTVRTDPRFIRTDLTQFELNEVAWIKPFGNENTELILENPEQGKVTVAFAVTDDQAVSGAGLIGTVSIVIVEDIVDFLVQEDTLKVEIDSITVVTDSLKKVPILGASIELEVEGRITSTSNPILDNLKLYPNPTNGWLLLQRNAVEVERVEVVDALGKVVFQENLGKNDFQAFDLQHLPKGTYWLKIITPFGLKNTPFQKL
ncbi:MAG: T9SS type A sorting domain-containing protein [Bacteroidota bacterium]